MTLEYVPLLQVQRDLYALPRDRTRFDAYLATLRDSTTGDLALPLIDMNPMGKEHVPALLDEYLAADTDGNAGRAVKTHEPALAKVPGSFRLCLVISDDLKGGWTNRYTSEFSHRFEPRAMLKRGWIVGLLWTSEPALAQAAVLEALVSLHRAAWIGLHGYPRSLRDVLAQEGWAMNRAGCTEPVLDDEDLAYTRDSIADHLDATDRATLIACVFGDAAAKALGYRPHGLSERAGLALALADGRREDVRRGIA